MNVFTFNGGHVVDQSYLNCKTVSMEYVNKYYAMNGDAVGDFSFLGKRYFRRKPGLVEAVK